MGWIFLVAAIVLEVGATLSLRASVTGSRLWYIPVVVGYLGAFVGLAFALGEDVPLGVAYGIWAAAGVAITAIMSRILFKEPLTLVMIGGILLVAAGVLLVETGSAH